MIQIRKQQPIKKIIKQTQKNQKMSDIQKTQTMISLYITLNPELILFVQNQITLQTTARARKVKEKISLTMMIA